MIFEEDGFSLSPVNFFQISADCHFLNKEIKNRLYLLPSTASLTDETSFATLHMGWNRDGITVLAVIEIPVTECCYPDVAAGDSVELFFDTRDVKTSGFNTRFCHHFFFLPEAVEGHMAGEITKFRTEDAHELCDPSELKVKVTKTHKSYSLEIFIPKQCLHGYDPDQFDRIGFTYRVNREGDILVPKLVMVIF